MSQKLKQDLLELGSNLENHPSSKDSLIKLLKHAVTLLSDVDQSPPVSILESMQPFLKAIVKPELLKHQDKDVKLLVASCLCEITRITAPEAPYSDEILKDIFTLVVNIFSGLADPSGPSFGRRVIILETLARYRSCVVMLDLDCDDLVMEIFRTFIAVARDDHPENVLTSMKTIMAVLVEESDDVHEDNLFTLLSSLGRNKEDVTEAARNLAMSVIKHCTVKFEPVVKQLLVSSMSGDNGSSERQIDFHEVIFDLYQCSPEILSGVLPYLTGELLADESETRLRAVKLVGELFAIPGHEISEAFQPIFTEFLKRLTDRVVEVRMTVLDYIKSCLLSYPSRPEAPQTFDALHDRLLDYDENVRKQVVNVVCDVACHDLDRVPVETMKLVAERLRDKSLLVKKYALERLAEIYRLDCLSNKGCANEYDWIPGKILRCFYDKDFRSDTVEYVLCETMFPAEFTVKHRVHQWIKILPGLDKVELKALEKILEQKQRLQQEMQKYLTFKKTYKDPDVPESQKDMLFFRVLSRFFTEPGKAEESFQVLDQLKDANIWKILSNIIDPSTSFSQACSGRDIILKILGEKHQLFDFWSTLSVKCSYILFSKEHVKEILLEVVAQKSAGSSPNVLSCINMLVILARYSAQLFAGSEDELLNLLQEDDEIIKEGILHVLAMAGGTIRERLASSSLFASICRSVYVWHFNSSYDYLMTSPLTCSSVDLILQNLCLEGSRRQAKYAVRALAAITNDDGLLSLSVLYKKLVDMLEEKSHLPSVLQSLGSIAQAAMEIFETRESEVIEFVKSNILQSSNKTKEKKKARWHDRSELCLLKIFGIKTLVKSYLPVKDAHLRGGIDNIIEILQNILSLGEISKDIKSSSADRAHLRLASAKAVLRLSRQWDHKIPADVFHLTVRTMEDKQINFPQARKVFRAKICQYIKDRVLDAKYACALLFSISGPKQEFEECKRDLADIIQMCRQVRARQLSMQPDANFSRPYPEFILPYLIHSLAHHPSFPCIEETHDVKSFERIYRIMYLFFSMVVYGDQDIRPDVKIAEKEIESISTLTSILHLVKRSVDVLDAAKSKNSYAICDLGLLIIKCLPKQPDHHGAITPLTLPLLTLPSLMYKPCEKEDSSGAEAGETTTWLANDSVAAHFESLKLESNGTAPPEIAEDEIVEDETDGQEMPLGKLIKHIKSQKVKAGKADNNSSAAKAKREDQGVDVLKVVQETSLDDLGISNKFESSNGHGDLCGVETKDHDEKETKRRKDSDDTSDPAPKRHRSSSVKGLSKRSASKRTKGLARTSLKNSLLKQEDNVPSDSELLAVCTKKKHKGTIFSQENDEGISDGEIASDEKVDLETETMGGNSGKSSSGTNNKKKRSAAGSSQDMSMGNGINSTDLVDCRIKVWWPVDKKFYGGVVKSYDPEKNKHVVLYNDGDVEVLRLDKECWVLIPDDGKLSKNSKPSKSPSKGGLSSKKTMVSDESRSKKPERDTPLKDIRTKKKGAKCKVEGVSKGKSAVTSENDALDFGDSEFEKADDEVESLPPKEEDDASKEVDEETKPSIESDRDESMEATQEDPQTSDAEKSASEEKLVEKPSEPSEMNSEDVQQPDDDEPIGNWKRRKGKSSKHKIK